MKKAKSMKFSGILRRILLSKPFCITVMVIMALLAFICLTRVVLGFMTVKHFEVQGETHYDISEIINAAEIRSGDKLYKIDEKAVSQRVVRECPYIKTVKIKQKFPSTVCFVVEEQEAGWYVSVGEEGTGSQRFYGLDFDMKVLSEEPKEEDFIERGLTRLVLPELEQVVVGELPKFASDDEHTMEECLKIIDEFRTHPMKERLTALDISNRFQIKLEIDNAYDVYFGEIDGFDTKMELLEATIENAKNEKNFVSGSITYIEAANCFALGNVEYGEDPTEESEEEDIID